MPRTGLSDYEYLWTSSVHNHALIRVDNGLMVYDKRTKRILMLEPQFAHAIIRRMLHANVEIHDDLAARGA